MYQTLDLFTSRKLGMMKYPEYYNFGYTFQTFFLTDEYLYLPSYALPLSYPYLPACLPNQTTVLVHAGN